MMVRNRMMMIDRITMRITMKIRMMIDRIRMRIRIGMIFVGI